MTNTPVLGPAIASDLDQLAAAAASAPREKPGTGASSRRVSIDALMSDSSPHASAESTRSGRVDAGSTPSYEGLQIELHVVQQPLHARMCGFGERDRRSIDPPPIVQLKVQAQPGVPPTLAAALLQNPLLVVHATLLDETGRELRDLLLHRGMNAMPVHGDAAPAEPPSSGDPLAASTPSPYGSLPTGTAGGDEAGPVMPMAMGPTVASSSASGDDAPRLTRVLMGNTVSSPAVIRDESLGVDGTYFIFPDLSIRTEGRYRLLFRTVVVSDIVGRQGAVQPIAAECVSDVFTSYSAKKFPGMTESTLITRLFANYGFRVPIRNDARLKSTHEKDDED